MNVSISVAAQMPAWGVSTSMEDPGWIQPACEMLDPRLPTWTIASSSSSSSTYEVHSRPSVDPERRIFRPDVWSLSGRKDTVVMSSECVELCSRIGIAGCRGSLDEFSHQ